MFAGTNLARLLDADSLEDGDPPMLISDGENLLKQFTDTAYPRTVTEVVPNTIFHVMGYGHSNASFIVANESVILIDTLDTDDRAKQLAAVIAAKTDKPVKTIIFTHGHPDHVSGASVFAGTNPEVIAFAPVRPLLARTDRLANIQNLRGIRQFGYELTDEEAISQGIGIREGFAVGQGTRSPIPPTTVYREPEVTREIDGVRLLLCSAPGETEDQIFIWHEEHKVLFCGDNYYGCWPNLYAIRGGQYRDVAAWIDSLDRIRAYPAEALLPGHTKPIIDRDAVAEVLANFRNALDYVLTETLACMDRGLGIDETAAHVQLPPSLRDLPYLQEFYGTVAWSVRAIYTGYLGWFDGNPTNLNPLPPREHATKTIALMGGEEAVTTAANHAVESSDLQWALELTDLLLAIDPDHPHARRIKATALRGLARQETSANGRHYYFDSAKELEPPDR
jgi:alkyl sulfatase BDS1-like metallo-beta-lactamase superfamily hydrolase